MKVGISAGTANSLLGPLLPFFMQCIKNPPQAAACGGLVGVWRFELQASWSRTKRATICAIPRKKTAAHRLPLWLRKKDSNPHNTSQSRRCYHYTIPHQALCYRLSALLLYRTHRQMSTLFLKFISNFFCPLRRLRKGFLGITLFPKRMLCFCETASAKSSF